MAKKLLIASGKGGVGKSTAAAALGRAFAHKGKKTLLIDCDAGLASLDILLNCREKTAFDWCDAYLGRCEVKECVISPLPNLFLIPAPRSTITADALGSVKSVTDEIENNYDIIIFDAPAGLGKGLARAAAAASQLLVTATADPVSVDGAAKLARIVRDLGINQSRLLINRYDVKAAKKGKLLTVDEIIDKTFVRLLGIIPEDNNISYSTVTGIIPPKCKSERAFARIADRLDGISVEFSLSLLK